MKNILILAALTISTSVFGSIKSTDKHGILIDTITTGCEFKLGNQSLGTSYIVDNEDIKIALSWLKLMASHNDDNRLSIAASEISTITGISNTDEKIEKESILVNKCYETIKTRL